MTTWFERQLDRLRSFDPAIVDAVLGLFFVVVGLLTVFGQEVTDELSEPDAVAVVTVLLVTVPVALRRRNPLSALTVSCLGILLHIGSGWPEGSLPLSAMLLTYTVGASETPRRAGIGLGVAYATLVILGITDTPGLDTIGVFGNLGIFTVMWAIGVALRARRETLEAQVRAAEERANVEQQSTARVLAEERLRIAQELHDVVAHSMSVIAVQAGVGAHVMHDRPEQARAALEAISATSRGTLTEMRRLLGVLRGSDGERADTPAPGLADLPRLVEDVRAAGVPVAMTVLGTPEGGNAGVELSAYRLVQEALTNVIKHAGPTSNVEVRLEHGAGSLIVEVVDDGRGAAAVGARVEGHGLVGMRERVAVWGGQLTTGPLPGGGYRVRAVLPAGAPG